MKKLILFSVTVIWILHCGLSVAADTSGVGARIGGIKLKKTDGKVAKIKKIKRDGIAVLAFWTPKSSAAKREVKKLHRFIQKQNDKTVMILVSRGKNGSDMEAAVQSAKEIGIDSHVYFDPDLAVVKSLEVKSVPWFIAVGADDTVLSPGFNSLETKFRNLTVKQIFSKLKSGEEIPFYEFVSTKPGGKTRELIGKKAPGFSARDLRNNEQSPEKYLDKKPLFIVLWRESCPHCRKELPRLQKFYLKYKEKRDFEILGVSITGKPGDRKKAEKYVADQMITFPNAVDDGGKISARFNLGSVPAIIYVDKNGIVRETQTGETQELDRLLLSFLDI